MGKLIIFSGASGCGKDTVLDEMLKQDPSLCKSISLTTRPPREEEADGVDYYFITNEELWEKEKRGEVLECAPYVGYYYGTPKKYVDEMLAQGKNVILKIEVEGAAKVRKLRPDALSIFLLPPSAEVLEKRLRNRGTDSEEKIQKRLARAEAEMERRVEYCYQVVNDDAKRAAKEVLKIIHQANNG
ncbi:MAG: guanylate kinase [Oscillospiraceae bacterium]|nr:guanylate kinase [Oscillospiraceae bacterium]